MEGTEWLTADYCNGTEVKVYQGVVAVTSRVTHVRQLVHAGQSVFLPA
ncbi:MAG: hypothetical protein ACLP22_19215 [Solirubrobacteraceae bacterium]